MLRFKHYREILVENDVQIENPEDLLQKEKLNNLILQINKVVDDWVVELKRTLINPITPATQRRGIWDRFKNSMSNMWHGRYNQSNPYFWQNKLGDDLGAMDANPPNEAFNPNKLSLHDYKTLKDICESLEYQINESVPSGAENLKIIKLIDDKAKQLKTALASILTRPQINQQPNINNQNFEEPEDADVSDENPADVNEIEPDSPSAHYDSLIPLIRKLAINKKISHSQAIDLENRLKSPKESIRNSAADEIMKIEPSLTEKPKSDMSVPASRSMMGTPPKSSETAPTSDLNNNPSQNAPEEESPSAINPEPSKAMSYDQPPTMGKKWNELQPYEKDKWNEYGGGISHAKGRKIDGCLNDHGIYKMPWIMRIGDPRREILIAQSQNQLPLSSNCKNKKSRSYWFDILRKTGRWENEDAPIKSEEDLKLAIEKAKMAMPRLDRVSAMNTEPNAPTEEKPNKPSLRDRVADLKIPNNTSPNETPKKDIRTRVAPMPLPDQFSKETPEPEVQPQSPEIVGQTPEIEKTKISSATKAYSKKTLKDRINSLTDEDLKDQMLRTLKMAKNKEDLSQISAEIDHHELTEGLMVQKNRIDSLKDEESKKYLNEKLNNVKNKNDLDHLSKDIGVLETAEDDNFQFEWTIKSKTAYLVKKLHERAIS